MNREELELYKKLDEKYQKALEYKYSVLGKQVSHIDSYKKHRQWKDGIIASSNVIYDDGTGVGEIVDDTSYIAEYSNFARSMIDASSIKISFTAKNQQTKEYIASVQSLVNLIINKADLGLNTNEAVGQCFDFGTGFLAVFFDTLSTTDYGATKNKGRITAEFLDFASVVVDPRAKTTDNMQFAFVVKNIPYEKLLEFKALYIYEEEVDELTDMSVEENGEPKLKEKFIYKNIDEIPENCIPEAHIEDEFYLDRLDEYDGSLNGVTWKRYFEKRFNTKTLTHYIHCVELANNIIIREEDLEISRMPIIAFVDESRRSSFYGISKAEKMLEKNKLFNISESIMSKQAGRQGANKYAYLEDVGVDKEDINSFITSPYDTSLGFKSGNGIQNINQIIQKIEMSPISAEQNMYQQNLKASLETTSGVSKFATGQNSGSITTSQGVNSMISQATETYRHWMRNEFVKGYRKAVDLILEYASYHLGLIEGNKIEMVYEAENGVYSELTVTKEQLDNARFDVLIDVLQGFTPDVNTAMQETKDFFNSVLQYGIKDNQFPVKFSHLIGKYYKVADSDMIVKDLIDYENGIEEQKMIFFHEVYTGFQNFIINDKTLGVLYANDMQVQQVVNELIKNTVMQIIRYYSPSEPVMAQNMAQQALPQLIAQIRQTLGLPPEKVEQQMQAEEEQRQRIAEKTAKT